MATTISSATFSVSTQTIVVGSGAASATGAVTLSSVAGTAASTGTVPLVSRTGSVTTTSAFGAPSPASSAASSAGGAVATETITQSLRPLTTIFTPPAYCLSSVNSFSGGYQIAPTQLPQCYPSASVLVYSPALCPSGYTVGLQNINLYRSASQDSAFATETEFRCCPSLLSYDIQSTICRTVVNQVTTSGNPPVLVTPTNPFSSEILWVSLPSVIAATGTGGWSSIDQIPFNLDTATHTVQAPVLYARLQSTDTAVSRSWDSILSLAASTPGPSSTSSGSTNNSSPGLSGGAIAGIVLGMIGALLSLLSISCFLLARRRKRRDRVAAESAVEKGSDSGEKGWVKNELDGTSKSVAELDSAKVAELQSPEAPPAELHASPIVELPGSVPGDKDGDSIKSGDGSAGSPRHWITFEQKVNGR